VRQLANEYPVSRICGVLELERSSFYYQSQRDEEDEVRQAIEEVARQFPTYGTRRVSQQLKRQPYQFEKVGRKRVGRLMREMGLQSKPKRRIIRTTNSRHPFPRFENLVKDLLIERINQVWVADLTYIKLRGGEFVYLAVVMDVYTRIIRGWALLRSLAAELSLAALEKAFAEGLPEIHHSDQGVQYACSAYVEMLQEGGVKISMAEVGHAEQNGYAERVIRTIKEEEVYLSEYEDYETALLQIGQFIDEVYRRKRIHSSLGYLTPAEFEAQCLKKGAASKPKTR
jgi:transposase InsO family protein